MSVPNREQESVMNQIKSTHEARVTSTANTTYDTNKAKYPTLDPTHSLVHIPNLLHVPVSTGDVQEHANKWVVLLLVALGGFMTTLDSSIVNIALPAIAHTFGVGVSGTIEWIIIGYLIVIAAFLLTLGRLADMVGRKPIYEAGLVIFVLGSIFSGAAPSLMTLGFSFGQEWGWTSPGIISSLVVGVVALVAAVLVERRVPDPILKLSLLKNRVFASANISFMFAMLALFATGFLLPFYFEELRGFPAVQAGLLLTPLSLMLAVMAPLSGSVADRFGSRILAPLGLAIACFGLVLLSQLNAQSSLWDIIWRLVVIGIGQGLFQSPNTRALMGAAPPDEQGIASGLLSTSRVIGQALSVALAGTIFTGFGAAAAGVLLSSQGQNLTTSGVSDLQNTFLAGFQAAFIVCAAFAAIGIFTSLVRGNEHKNRQTQPETQ